MTFVRWIFGFLLSLALLILIAAMVLPRVIDPNDYADDIAQLVANKTGRQLSIDGDLSVSVFPWLGVQTGPISLSQPDVIGGEFVSTQGAQLRVKFMPLLSKRVEVDTIVLAQPKINYITLASGVSSLDGLSDEQASSQAAVEPEQLAMALAVQGIEISDASLILDDRQAQSKTEVRNLNLSTGDLLSGEFESLSARGTLLSSAEYSAIDFELQGEAKINVHAAAVELRSLSLESTFGEHAIALTLDTLAYAENQIDIEKLFLTALSGLPISASIPVLNINLIKEQVSAELLSAKLADAELQARQFVLTGFDDVGVTASLSLADTDLRELLQALDIDYQPQNNAALKSVSLNAQVDASLDSLAARDLTINLDQTTLNGSFSVTNFNAPTTQFDLQLDRINVDDYIPQAESNDSAEPEVEAAEALAVPMAVFKDLKANGRLRIQQLSSAGVSMTDIDVQVNSGADTFTITPTAKLYDGELAGKFAYTQTGGGDQLRIQQQMDLVDLGRLLSDADISDQLRGIGKVDVDLLVTELEGQQSNSGTIKLAAEKGAFSGVDVNQILGQANSVLSLLNSKPDAQEADVQASGETDKAALTEFAELNGTFNLANNVLQNDDFAMQAPAFSIAGMGSIDIAAQSLDYLLTITVADAIPGQLGQSLDKVLGKSIPIRCTGALEAPLCLPDTKELYALYLDSKIKQKQGQLLEEKFGVEGGEQLSTKEALKQVLINKALNKDKERRQQQADTPASDNAERPITERDAEQRPSGEPSSEAEEPNEESQEDGEAPAEEESLEDRLKRELLERLLN